LGQVGREKDQPMYTSVLKENRCPVSCGHYIFRTFVSW
jgi:hypothetical protein